MSVSSLFSRGHVSNDDIIDNYIYPTALVGSGLGVLTQLSGG